MDRPTALTNDTPYVDTVDTVDTKFLGNTGGLQRAARALIHHCGVYGAHGRVRSAHGGFFCVVPYHTQPWHHLAQLCNHLNILAPNLVAMVNSLEKKKLMVRKPHPLDGRAMGLHLTVKGHKLMAEAEKVVNQLELDATSKLTATERKTLLALLKKVYK